MIHLILWSLMRFVSVPSHIVCPPAVVGCGGSMGGGGVILFSSTQTLYTRHFGAPATTSNKGASTPPDDPFVLVSLLFFPLTPHLRVFSVWPFGL